MTKDIVYRLATAVAPFTDGAPRIQFYGETSASEKKYPFVHNVEQGDTVLVACINGNYVIIGTVNTSIDSAVEYLTTADAAELYATIDHDHDDTYAAKAHSHTCLYNDGKTLYLSNDGYLYSATTLDIGSSTNKFNSLYINNVYATTLYDNGYAVLPNKIYNPTSSNTKGNNDYTIMESTALRPSLNNNYNLGSSSYKWSTVYATTGTINTSDKNEKNSIELMDERYESFFKTLKPVRYKYNDGESNRYHTGYISNDVEEELQEANLDSLDFAGFIKTPVTDDDGNETGQYQYGLRYAEFISLNTMMIQKLIEKNEMLEKRIEELEAKINGQNL